MKDIVDEDIVLNKEKIMKVKMPNADGINKK